MIKLLWVNMCKKYTQSNKHNLVQQPIKKEGYNGKYRYGEYDDE